MAIKKYNVDTQVWEYITPTKAEFDGHAGKVATATELGHVMVDGVTITIDTNGRISAVGGGDGTGTGGATVVDATTLVKGIAQLNSAIDSDSEEFAATPKAVKDALAAAQTFTTEQIAALVDAAPETLNTLNELAIAAQEADTALEGLVTVIGGKAAQADLDAHVQNAEAHITPAEREIWNAGSKIHVGAEAPANPEHLWISPIV